MKEKLKFLAMVLIMIVAHVQVVPMVKAGLYVAPLAIYVALMIAANLIFRNINSLNK